jgi:hypothetical protein
MQKTLRSRSREVIGTDVWHQMSSFFVKELRGCSHIPQMSAGDYVFVYSLKGIPTLCFGSKGSVFSAVDYFYSTNQSFSH